MRKDWSVSSELCAVAWEYIMPRVFSTALLLGQLLVESSQLVLVQFVAKMSHFRSLSRLLVFLLLLVCGDVSTAKDKGEPATWPAAEWGKAGVPADLMKNLPVIANLQPGDDVQTAIDAAPVSGGVIFLTPGDYLLTAALRLRSHMVLRGRDRVRTRLVIQMRSLRPDIPIAEDSSLWTSGIRFDALEESGLEELTIVFDHTLPPPMKLSLGSAAFKDDPGDQKDLHVVSLCIDAARNCWITKCLIQNSGTCPLVIANSQNILVEEVIFEGAYNRGEGSGICILSRSTYTRFEKVKMGEINSFVLMSSSDGPDCRYNVISASSFEIDVRVHGQGTMDNLIENTEIALANWLDRTPLSPGNVNAREVPPGPGNLVYLCTITRDFGIGRRAFSMADNPSMIYEVIETRARDRESSVAVFAPAPPVGSLIDSP